MGDKVPRPAPSSSPGVEDDVRRFGRGIEDDVKDLIEKCLQQYMTLGEAKTSLRENFDIDPRLTHLVWKKLEEDNRQFFRDYYIRLKLIEQINQFNYLLGLQQQFEQRPPQGAFGKPTPPQGEPSPDVAAGWIYQQQLSNAMPVQYGNNVLGGMYGDHCALNGTAAIASMGSSAQALSLHSINQTELLTHASSEQPMPLDCYISPFNPLGKCEQGASPAQNQGHYNLLNHPASSSFPDLGGAGFEPEADQLNSLDFLLDSPEHHDTGSQTPGKTY